MKYRLRRNRKLAFQNFQDSLKRAADKLLELESEVVPHYSDWYEVNSMQELVDQLEFRSEAEGDDEVLTEDGVVIGHVEEELAMPVLVCKDGTEWAGPQVRAAGDTAELDSEQYAEKLVSELRKKGN
jgi:hypothetical protein